MEPVQSDTPVSGEAEGRARPGVAGMQGEESACLPQWNVLVGSGRWGEMSPRSQTLVLACPDTPGDLLGESLLSGPQCLHRQWGLAQSSDSSSSRDFLGLPLSGLQLSQVLSLSSVPA